MGSPTPMGMGTPGPGVPLGGSVHHQALGAQSYPQQPGKIKGFYFSLWRKGHNSPSIEFLVVKLK